MKREDVYKLIDGEREYQQLKWGDKLSNNRPGHGERTIDEFALYILGYAHKLLDSASTFADQDANMAIIRKIGGLCVAAMEQHETPERKL